ncbi:MAG TPA: hypothetical protein VK891_05285, partial [Euzebyales bacterium]|nr:hypothetical protein [Euzebyales bacterium]
GARIGQPPPIDRRRLSSHRGYPQEYRCLQMVLVQPLATLGVFRATLSLYQPSWQRNFDVAF